MSARISAVVFLFFFFAFFLEVSISLVLKISERRGIGGMLAENPIMSAHSSERSQELGMGPRT